MKRRFRYSWLHIPSGKRGTSIKAISDTRAEAWRVSDLFDAACVAVNYWNLGGGDWVYWIDPNNYAEERT